MPLVVSTIYKNNPFTNQDTRLLINLNPKQENKLKNIIINPKAFVITKSNVYVVAKQCHVDVIDYSSIL